MSAPNVMPAAQAATLADEVVRAIASVTGGGPVPLHAPVLTGNESRYLQECIDSTFVSSVGRFVDRLEADLAAATGARHAVVVVNGTAALHMAFLVAGVQPGDEVLVPALTFVATAAAVRHCGAIPHFVDSEARTLGMDAVALRSWLEHVAERRAGTCVNRQTGRPLRALVPMHTFGHPCDIDGLLQVAQDFGLVLVEDAAESLGSTYQGRHTGTFGALGTLSFNGNKVVTTGGGGAILTDDLALARRAKHLTTTAKVPHAWEFVHDAVGYNYRMPNVNAALGCAQLERLGEFLASKRRLFARYQEVFAGVRGVQVVSEPAGCTSNFWLQTLLLDDDVADQRDAILERTNAAGLMTRPAWMLMHRLAPYQDAPRAPLPVAESLVRRMVNIPSSAGIA